MRMNIWRNQTTGRSDMNKTYEELLQEVQDLQAQLRESLDHNASLLAQRDRLRVELMLSDRDRPSPATPIGDKLSRAVY